MTNTHKTEIRDGHVIKTELKSNPQKRNSLEKEESILRELAERQCPCIPAIIDSGTDAQGNRFLVTEMIRQEAGLSLPDLWLSYLAVRGCGWEHGDLMRRHAIDNNALTYLIDFDQAFPASDLPSWKDGFVDADLHPRLSAIDGRPFCLADTRLAGRGVSTMGSGGIYHSISESIGGQEVFIHGERSATSRFQILDRIDFTGERVVDFGCNTGLITRYLARESGAAEVRGIERCEPHAILGQLLNCALGLKKCRIVAGEIAPSAVPSNDYHTALLFSVVHHAEDLRKVSETVTGAGFKRLLIETKPQEVGYSFTPEGWNRSGGWNLHSWEALHAHLEAIFPGFRFNRNYGESDRGRRIIEMVRY